MEDLPCKTTKCEECEHSHIILRIREDGTLEKIVTACLLQDFGMGEDEQARDL